MGQQLSIPAKTSNSLVLADVRGKANPYFISKDKARIILIQRIKEEPGRYTVVDLMGITGITTTRINRLLREDRDFIAMARKGMIAVPRMGRRPTWFNSRTPIVAESFWKGAFAMKTFSMRGDPDTSKLASSIFEATRSALVSSNRAPQTIMLLQDQIAAELRTHATKMSNTVQTARMEAQKRLSGDVDKARTLTAEQLPPRLTGPKRGPAKKTTGKPGRRKAAA